MMYVLTKTKCSCCVHKYTKTGAKRLFIPAKVGFGDTLADWIHKVLKIKPCAACQKRRRILNILFPYIPRDSLQYRAWNDYLKSGLGTLPVIWDSDTGDVIRPN
jgi:hypothetical protein